jgi:hypothetical protein
MRDILLGSSTRQTREMEDFRFYITDYFGLSWSELVELSKFI